MTTSAAFPALAPAIANDASCAGAQEAIPVGTIGHSQLISQLIAHGKLDPVPVAGKWEAAIVVEVDRPMPGMRRALVIAGSDPRGAAFALFDLSRAIGVSPWYWWADVPVVTHRSAYVTERRYIQPSPAVQYRGIFLNDEDWGLRPWAARKMDVSLNNIGPATYGRIFELLMRLHANTLWPAMHPGSMPFNMVPEKHPGRCYVGHRDGLFTLRSHAAQQCGCMGRRTRRPMGLPDHRKAIRSYWDKRVEANAAFDNIYTVGMRGQQDSRLQATGTEADKARLVEQVIADQRAILAQRVNHDLSRVPQVIWLHKESIDLYRAGMHIPDDVTLGWTDDNYGYLRQLPNAAEQRRSGGSALYYHVSYFGAPHDYLWLASTPPALMREELTKAFDHGVRRMWILNVGDLKPAEKEIDYFLQLASRTPQLREETQTAFLQQWFAENFPQALAGPMAKAQDEYYHLNFIRKPEFMGFNGYTDGVRRTAFNPLAWGDQNRTRLEEWTRLDQSTEALQAKVPSAYRSAFFELLGYSVEASAEQNRKFLWADRSYVDHHRADYAAVQADAGQVQDAFHRIGQLTSNATAWMAASGTE